ncbi:HAD family acid phosphatase [Sphingomonas hengshuiensis]|uniref:HAD family acid phosphatase n=1 Tax=Sphingomonas hengshuiensis TaxID=1609977 RepID=UPI000AA7FAD1|nr:HAD family acid phosphatase [Sphingomonas hengshuiensis]
MIARAAKVTLGAAVASMLLSGCVAAAVPAVAAAGLYKTRQDSRDKARKSPKPAEPVAAGQVVTAPDGSTLRITSLTALPPPGGQPVAGPPPEMQYLYGSGEAAALSVQAYRAMYSFLRNELGHLRDKRDARSVVLAPGSTIEDPRFYRCGALPQAVVLDIDETALLNLGFEADAVARGGGYDAARWARWEQTGADKVAAVPGAAETLAALRRDGYTVIFNSNRATSSAAQTVAALDHAGLGPAVLGDTLWLRGDGEASGKDTRRAKIAERYCVVAMAGDQLGDFTDLFNAPATSVRARRNLTSETALAPLWGAGWFMLPNPVYGSGLKGGLDDIFPPETRWTDPQEKK